MQFWKGVNLTSLRCKNLFFGVRFNDRADTDAEYHIQWIKKGRIFKAGRFSFTFINL